MKKLSATVLAVVLTATLLSASPASACSCIIDWTPLENLEAAAAVFTGRVVAVFPLVGEYGEEIFVYSIQTHMVWKGDSKPYQIVYSARDSAQCGLVLTEEEDYLLYASRVGGDLYVNLCSRSTLVAFAQEDLDALGDPISVGAAATSMSMLKGRFDR